MKFSKKEHLRLISYNHTSCISPKRGMIHKAKRKTAKRVRQYLDKILKLDNYENLS